MTEAGPPDAALVGRLAAELELDPQAGMTARLLNQAEAVTAAGRAFGSLLNQSNPPEEAP